LPLTHRAESVIIELNADGRQPRPTPKVSSERGNFTHRRPSNSPEEDRMSGRTAARQPHPRPARANKAAGLLVAGCALLVGVVGSPAAAQPEKPKDPPTTGTPLPPVTTADETPVDERAPLPPGEPPRPSVAVQYRVPGRDRQIFRDIQDLRPVLSEKASRGEYDAWTEVVLFAHQWKAAELEANAARDLTYGDLKQPNRNHFRLDLLRFDGKLTTITAVRPSKALAEAGIKVLYQGWLVPTDEPPANKLWVAFTELPAGVPTPELPEGKDFGPAVTVDKWVSFAGYFFKMASYPGPEAADATRPGPGWLNAPLLVGKSVTLLAEEPGRDIRPDRNLRIFQLIQDDKPVATEDQNWGEYAAWNRLILHARKFSAEELEKAARPDVGYADLHGKGRRDYKLELVKFEGHLKMLRRHEPGKLMREAGVEATYEGWLIPVGGYAVNPVCVVFSELPDGITVPDKAHEINRFVSFAGYSFKLMHYESGEEDKAKPGKHLTRSAPMLIGRAVVPRPDPDAAGTLSWRTFVLGALGLVAVVLAVAFGLSYWFRRGDRVARREVETVRGRNPFAGPTADQL
jgi:hypothetical protein